MSHPSPLIRAFAGGLGLLGALLVAACASAPPEPSAPPGPPGARGPACALIGCSNGFSVDWESSSGWKPGRYTFEIELDGARTTCEAKLPLRACEEGPSVSCAPSGAVQIGESGCALPPGQHGFSGFSTTAFPAAVTIVIKRDGEQILREERAPTYRTVEPNGPDCPPTCRQAHEALRVP